MSEYVTTHGPLFDGRAEGILDRAAHDIRKALADKGEQLVRAEFGSSIREDRGRFLSSITVIDHSKVETSTSGHHSYSMPVTVDPATEMAVTTELATYGPWLEGTGSRNETTRFKGYHGFRRAGQELDRMAEEISDEVMAKAAEEMNR